MKQKYTINIADVVINILSEGDEENVNAIVSKVDSTIRAIRGNTGKVSTTEAAILCALQFCSMCDQADESRTANDSQVDQLNEELKKSAAAIAKLEAKIEAQKEKADANAAALKERYDALANAQKEKYEGRIDNMKTKYEARIAKLEAKLSEQTGIPADPAQQLSMDLPEEKTEEPQKVEEPAKVEAAPAAEPASAEAPAKAKNKVGSMFELLTFGDV